MSDEPTNSAEDEDEDDAPLAILATVKDLAKWMPEGIVGAYGARPVWFVLAMDAELVTVFERIPEDPMPKGKIEAILSGLRTFAKERNAELQQLLGPTDGIQLGFHVDAPLSRVVESFEEDGFDVIEGAIVDGEVDLEAALGGEPAEPAS
jgi:hypothetical protein